MTRLTKRDVQKRVLQNGKPLALSRFNWDEKTRTFSSDKGGLVLDFLGVGDCTFSTGWDCTFSTGSRCTFSTGSDCVIVRRDLFEVIQPKEGDIIQLCPRGIEGYLVNGIYNGKPHIIADGILSEVISHKGNLYKVINHSEKESSYIVQRDDVYAHGETPKDARDAIIYKLSDRDTNKWENVKLDDALKREDAIQMYMAVTGACSSGTQYFAEQNNYDMAEIKVADLITITKGQYGNDKFKKFVAG